MNALTTSLGRLPTIRRRESKKQVKPINVDAAQRFVPMAGPSSSSTLTTPRPSDFLGAPSSSMTPPHSPYHFADHPSSTAASSSVASPPVRSPIRRAFSRTFRFGGGIGGSNPTGTGNQGHRESHSRSSTPMQISAPLMEPQPQLSSPDSFDMDCTRTSVANRRRSRTLLPPLPINDETFGTGDHHDQATLRGRPRPASSSSRIRSFWGGDSSADSSPSLAAAVTPSMRQSSLRSIRQLHQRALSSWAAPTTPEPSEHLTNPRPPPAPIAEHHYVPRSNRLMRRASEESFFCRGLGYDSVEASTTALPDVPLTAPLPGMAARRMSNFTKDAHGIFAVEISTATSKKVFGDAAADGEAGDNAAKLSGLGFTDYSPAAPRPKVKRLSVASRASDTSSLDADSYYSSTSSLPSQAASETTTASSVRMSWPEVPAQWFSSCPPTPPSAIRLRLQFLSLPRKTGTFRPVSPAADSPINEDGGSTSSRGDDVDNDDDDGQPLDALFLSSNNSVLDLKELISERLRTKGYRVFPKELSISLNLADSLLSSSSPSSSSPSASDRKSGPHPSALGLAFNEDGCSPIKHLGNNSRLLFEEGAQEDDTIVIRYLPYEVSTTFF
ncbi:uncharacterized protein PFL1_06002 [Pseudozyma flocculosa PF-1]|uniref:Uncharacterized protein n=2 Tax=Pseudozyma flocculosa TaxID=84751 RepID=A0A5C3F6J7_9BASI|nr:uncharacterized protein PFL1_06002 [Pseudozyma flocculosa PF-1]EPQ26354.1 hypothetical protein PFL1_06002 [Pseudozyma flocculosa PF-1]SPO39059.1 uncharacterized protein PSFLO_04538 [Pseudozyma flocculosa]